MDLSAAENGSWTWSGPENRLPTAIRLASRARDSTPTVVKTQFAKQETKNGSAYTCVEWPPMDPAYASIRAAADFKKALELTQEPLLLKQLPGLIEKLETGVDPAFQ
jgi:hypothetical protein